MDSAQSASVSLPYESTLPWERILQHTSDNKLPVDLSPNGDVLFVNEDAVTGDDLWVLPLNDPQQSTPLLKGTYAESQGQFSPNGRWIAYRSHESGRWEISVRPYPGPGSQQPVSKGGGIQPRWRRDGKELFYIGTPTPLFTARLVSPTNLQFGYAVNPDGQRFLIDTIADQTVTTPITVVQNWTSVIPK